MAKILRLTGGLVPFAANAAEDDRYVFGTTDSSNSLDANVNADYKAGWGSVAGDANDAPTIQDFNALGYTQGQLIAYQMQMGVPEYDTTQTYYPNSVCTHNGQIFISLVNNLDQEPGDPARWRNVTGVTDVTWDDINGQLPLSKLPNHSASKITSGIITEPRIDRLIARGAAVTAEIAAAISASAVTIRASITTTWADIAGLLPLNKLPNHSASKITSGTLTDARIPSTIARRAAVTAEIATAVRIGATAAPGGTRVVLKAYATSITGSGRVVASTTGTGDARRYTTPSNIGKQYVGTATIAQGAAVPLAASAYSWAEIPGRIEVVLADFGETGTTVIGNKTLSESLLNFDTIEFEVGHVNPSGRVGGIAVMAVSRRAVTDVNASFIIETVFNQYIHITRVSDTQIRFRDNDRASLLSIKGIR